MFAHGRVAAFAATTALAIAPAAAQAAPLAPAHMQIVRQAVTLKIQLETNHSPAAMKFSCEDDSPLIKCNGAWRDKRFAYKGRIIVVEVSELEVLFAGIRTDRACAAKKKGLAKRLCSEPYVF